MKKANSKAMPEDKRLKLDVAKYLQGLGDGRIAPPRPQHGICNAVDNTFGDKIFWVYGLISNYSKGWEHYSGDHPYPIPCTQEQRRQSNYWVGKYGDLRRDLCLFIAKQLRKEVRAGNYSLEAR